MTVNFHPVLLAKGKWPLSEEKAQCFYGLATVVSSDETFDVTQFAVQLSDKWKKDVEETVGSYIGMASGKVPMFGFGFVSEGQAKEEATNEEIKKLDEWLGLEDKLIDAFNTSNKSEVEKFLSESVIRKASIKFHPDKAAQNNMSTEEAHQKFQEFTELVKKAREKLSRLN